MLPAAVAEAARPPRRSRPLAAVAEAARPPRRSRPLAAVPLMPACAPAQVQEELQQYIHSACPEPAAHRPAPALSHPPLQVQEKLQQYRDQPFTMQTMAVIKNMIEGWCAGGAA